jgi:uroporphyrinogen-III synthase
MYHPYFRGKQYELITIRDTADLLRRHGFVPIVEPVRESLNGLRRALEAVTKAAGSSILIVNPVHGDHSDDGDAIANLKIG